MADVESHRQPIEALNEEGVGLKAQGSPDDCKKLDHWIEDTMQRWEELSGAVEDKEVSFFPSSHQNPNLSSVVCIIVGIM